MNNSHHRTCGCIIQDQILMEMVEGYRERRIEVEQACRIIESDLGGTARGAFVTVTIPVVVHVVYNAAVENISDEQIASQIRILNEDFSATNPDISDVPNFFKSLIGKSSIQFKLAKRAPDGSSTNGITRTQTTRSSFPPDEFLATGFIEPVKFDSSGGKDAWPSDKYLNMWVCNLRGGLLGYAQFPGGPAETDGVVMDYQYFGDIGTATPPFDKGRTATHEVGHYLNLRHIWGDDQNSADPCSGSDLVNDTPNQEYPSGGIPTHPRRSCGSPDMFMNYMDYTDDAGMFMFSKGQVVRMQAALEGPRASLTTSDGLTAPCG
ncbi:Pregnancy-associated plasma protein-A [Xenococcus sp. PCC 7305]|uniref:zinc metalloprotease n=1 Tax=Xenococcus sp. PCC 7305 TaxID=102125 RepID=UPI0002AC2E4E|nr:zinc metalloprotease [Xenococcus sp. PCC 7305]ELS01738.1 Pregnancy-associated plasma protein-A [Xenococcus sp. PCC 7305]